MKHDPIYPETPGHRHIDTSIDAAAVIAPHCGRLQRMALQAVRDAGDAGLTTDELSELLRVDRGSVQPRTSELKLMGLIRDSGARRQSANGKKAIVWVAEGGSR